MSYASYDVFSLEKSHTSSDAPRPVFPHDGLRRDGSPIQQTARAASRQCCRGQAEEGDAMRKKQTYTRRTFVGLGGVAAADAAGSLAGCAASPNTSSSTDE